MPKILELSFSKSTAHIVFEDGMVMNIPLAWYTKLISSSETPQDSPRLRLISMISDDNKFSDYGFSVIEKSKLLYDFIKELGGIRAVKVADLSEKLGVSKSTIYYYRGIGLVGDITPLIYEQIGKHNLNINLSYQLSRDFLWLLDGLYGPWCLRISNPLGFSVMMDTNSNEQRSFIWNHFCNWIRTKDIFKDDLDYQYKEVNDQIRFNLLSRYFSQKLLKEAE